MPFAAIPLSEAHNVPISTAPAVDPANIDLRALGCRGY